MNTHSFFSHEFSQHTNGEIIFWSVVGLFLFLAVAYVALFLWNRYLATLFRAPKLSFAQVLAILLLIRILLGGMNGHSGSRHFQGKEDTKQIGDR